MRSVLPAVGATILCALLCVVCACGRQQSSASPWVSVTTGEPNYFSQASFPVYPDPWPEGASPASLSDLTVVATTRAVRRDGSFGHFVIVSGDEHDYQLALLELTEPAGAQLQWAALKPMTTGLQEQFPGLVSTVIDPVSGVEALAVSFWPEKNKIFLHMSAIRKGAISIHGREVEFAIVSSGNAHDELYVDANGDGKMCVYNPACEELSRASSPYFEIDGASFTWSVVAGGGSLRVRPADGEAPMDLRVVVGSSVPEIEFDDVAGHAASLSDYRDQVLLLYFWGTWCGPCVGTTEQLRQLYARVGGTGFEILGVSDTDLAEVVQAYAEQNDIPWRQTATYGASPFDRIMVAGIPSFMLIDQNGMIASRSRDVTELEEVVDRLLANGTAPTSSYE